MTLQKQIKLQLDRVYEKTNLSCKEDGRENRYKYQEDVKKSVRIESRKLSTKNFLAYKHLNTKLFAISKNLG